MDNTQLMWVCVLYEIMLFYVVKEHASIVSYQWRHTWSLTSSVTRVFHWQFEQLQEWSMRLLNCDYISHFQDFLENTSSKSILTTRIKLILVEVFKSLNELNASCLHDMFKNNDTPYDVRAPMLEQPLRRTTNYGMHTFYIGFNL